MTLRPCAQSGCPVLIAKGGYCPAHTPKRVMGTTRQAIRRQILKNEPYCRACGVVLLWEFAVIDHIVPLFQGGTETPENRQPLCRPCHKVKTREDLGAMKGSRRGF